MSFFVRVQARVGLTHARTDGVPHGESPAVFVPQSRREWDLVMRPLGDAEKANFGIIACGAALKEGGICNQILGESKCVGGEVQSVDVLSVPQS